MNTSVNNLTDISRAVRIIIGLLLVIGANFNIGFLGTMAALPLIAIYPLMTGTWGWDPIEAIYEFIKTSTRAAVAYTRIPAAT